MRRRFRIAVLAGYLATGGLLFQAGPLCTVINSTATAGIAGSGGFIDENGNFLGLFNVCGVPNVLFVDEDGIAIDGTVFNTEDDLMFGCPITFVEVQDDDNNGGGG